MYTAIYTSPSPLPHTRTRTVILTFPWWRSEHEPSSCTAALLSQGSQSSLSDHLSPSNSLLPTEQLQPWQATHGRRRKNTQKSHEKLKWSPCSASTQQYKYQGNEPAIVLLGWRLARSVACWYCATEPVSKHLLKMAAWRTVAGYCHPKITRIVTRIHHVTTVLYRIFHGGQFYGVANSYSWSAALWVPV